MVGVREEVEGAGGEGLGRGDRGECSGGQRNGRGGKGGRPLIVNTYIYILWKVASTIAQCMAYCQ